MPGSFFFDDIAHCTPVYLIPLVLKYLAPGIRVLLPLKQFIKPMIQPFFRSSPLAPRIAIPRSLVPPIDQPSVSMLPQSAPGHDSLHWNRVQSGSSLGSGGASPHDREPNRRGVDRSSDAPRPLPAGYVRWCLPTMAASAFTATRVRLPRTAVVPYVLEA